MHRPILVRSALWAVSLVPRRTRGRRTLVALLVCLAVGGVIVGPLLGGRRAGAEPGPHGSACPAVVRRYAGQIPAGWTVTCLSRLPDAWRAAAGGRAASAMSSRDERRIVVIDGQRPEYTEASLAHEIAHAESSAWPPELRVAFARAVGETQWAGRAGGSSPMEVFAESSVRCRGLPTHPSYPLVPCNLVEAARSAGGAVDPLPVTGSSPTS